MAGEKLTCPGSPCAKAQTILTTQSVVTASVSGDSFAGVERYTTAIFWLQTGTGTGTSPTCDVYIQTLLPDNTTWQDIIHFTQATTTATSQIAHFVTGAASIAAVQTAALAAATTKAISLGHTIRARVVIGGTNPSYATIGVTANFYE